MCPLQTPQAVGRAEVSGRGVEVSLRECHVALRHRHRRGPSSVRSANAWPPALRNMTAKVSA